MMTFRLIVFFISLLILTFEWILYRRWKGRFGDRRWFRYARIVYWGIVLVTQAFLWMWIAGIRMTTPISGPGYVLYSFILAWQYNHLLLFPLFGIFILIGFLIRKSTAVILSRIRRGPDEAVESHPVQKSAELKNDRAAGKNPERKGLSRGDFLKRMTFAGGVVLDSVPLIGTAAVVSGIFLGSKDVVVERRQFRIRDLHPDLQGLRIVQVSDIHVGTLIHDEYLSKCVEIIRGLRADMLIATGDIIDNNNYFIPVAGRFFRPLVDALPMGAYGIPGNHDHIDNGAVAVSGLRSSGLRMLVNQTAVISRGRGRLNIMGLDYPWGPNRRDSERRRNKSREYFQRAELQKFPDAPTMVLNHHPMEFEYLKNENIDLVFAGHTHGGQIVLNEDRSSALNLARNFYEFYRGHYVRNDRQLYVNSGLGHWFPLRIDCPPEITLIELI